MVEWVLASILDEPKEVVPGLPPFLMGTTISGEPRGWDKYLVVVCIAGYSVEENKYLLSLPWQAYKDILSGIGMKFKNLFFYFSLEKVTHHKAPATAGAL